MIIAVMRQNIKNGKGKHGFALPSSFRAINAFGRAPPGDPPACRQVEYHRYPNEAIYRAVFRVQLQLIDGFGSKLGLIQTLSLLDSTYVITYDNVMSTLTASEARAKLYRLIDEAAESHVPIRITGKRNSALLISEEDWASVQETMYLLSIPGMRESIREGMESPAEECEAEIDW